MGLCLEARTIDLNFPTDQCISNSFYIIYNLLEKILLHALTNQNQNSKLVINYTGRIQSFFIHSSKKLFQKATDIIFYLIIDKKKNPKFPLDKVLHQKFIHPSKFSQHLLSAVSSSSVTRTSPSSPCQRPNTLHNIPFLF